MKHRFSTATILVPGATAWALGYTLPDHADTAMDAVHDAEEGPEGLTLKGPLWAVRKLAQSWDAATPAERAKALQEDPGN